MTTDLAARKAEALRILRDQGRVLVALSGGVDSSVLLALALEAIGPRAVLAVTGRSPAVAAEELDAARRVAADLGARHEVVLTSELDSADYRANAGDRCYHCRSELFRVLGRLAVEGGFSAVAYGAITDDLGDDRPGMRAAEDAAVIAPLLAAGLSKVDVRTLAGALGLRAADKPANACLASRIPRGTEVTVEKLAQVERAERALRRLGLSQVRVRHHGDVARLEVDPAGRAILANSGAREAAAREVRRAGFRFVALDLEDFRSGRLNVVGSSDPAALPARIEGLP